MGLFFYNISITFMRLLVGIASPFNSKARLFTSGRKNLQAKISTALKDNQAPVAWFHCASLGEFEQGRPVIEAFGKEFPAYKILLTFFSPSGFQVRKNYDKADYVFYLPVDTKANARKFIQTVNPTVAFFIKYEFWYHYLTELAEKDIPAISVSAIFRKEQLFFKPYGGFYRDILKKFDHLFLQNKQSAELLKSIDIFNTTLAGDTRFDRVAEVAKSIREIPLAKQFKGEHQLMVIGSSWPEDISVLLPFINENPYHYKFIIAPHEIHKTAVIELTTKINKSIRFSKAGKQPLSKYDVLIIDNVGMLSSLYQYGDLAYIGGAFGKGLHNILEAATFGMPLLFGDKNYKKFREARDLIRLGGAFPLSDSGDLLSVIEKLNDPEERSRAAKLATAYIRDNTGATRKIMEYWIKRQRSYRPQAG